MAIFNSYVKLPEGISIFLLEHPQHPGHLISHCASGPVIRQTWLFPSRNRWLHWSSVGESPRNCHNLGVTNPLSNPRKSYYLCMYICMCIYIYMIMITIMIIYAYPHGISYINNRYLLFSSYAQKFPQVR